VLAGFARDGRMNVYAPERVGPELLGALDVAPIAGS
jgi:hypothetical protein